jgi:hypothetical protein
LTDYQQTGPFGTGQFFVPPEPDSVEDTGLALGFLTDLALKILYFRGYVTGAEIAEEMCLPFPGVVERLLDFLKRDQMCEIKGAGGFGRRSPTIAPASGGSRCLLLQSTSTTCARP